MLLDVNILCLCYKLLILKFVFYGMGLESECSMIEVFFMLWVWEN